MNTQQRAAQKLSSKKTTACVTVFVFFTIKHGTFPYSIGDDASTTSQTPTTHYTNTFVKLTIVTHLSSSERIVIANLSFIVVCGVCELFKDWEGREYDHSAPAEVTNTAPSGDRTT